MTLIALLILLDLLIFVAIYFWYINKYVLSGQIWMSLAVCLILGLINYLIFLQAQKNQGTVSSCACTSEEIEFRLNQLSQTLKKNKNADLEPIRCCFPSSDFQILVREDYQIIDASDTLWIESKPVRMSIQNYLQYLGTVYSADTIRVINLKTTTENELMYLEVQEINK